MKIRNVTSSDYDIISPVINEWWGGRQMAHMLPKVFFVHFNDTSFIMEQKGEIIGFLIGFFSQSDQDVAYIHFVGVHPDYRKQHIGKQLYSAFFNEAEKNGKKFIRALTSPVNKTSIAYHTKSGFAIEQGDKEVDGVSVFTDYDGEGQDRVLFVKDLLN
ncbi:GNAT family N-acetyltransferase [Gracilibacillus caseinilyticus]|uniref:GNAT family N-acetyltransferase n=1 Tax=Gracilibacillus caseinilyticus TaxID=2932256 RepID=A0ABY4F1Q7_9BACI|nr:GNAT family N-acetyltransferase [Gracilibacillus caseinilyticus]UOQ50161.1 GNAT family N-acetyltransferase [Gracilibacillus caseinilyticus]